MQIRSGCNWKQLIASMADVFESRIDASLRGLTRTVEAHYDRLAHAGYERQIDVSKDRQFVGFDGYKKAMDCLRPGDIAILASPPAFRWAHFGYAVAKGLHVFMEKPLTADGPTSRSRSGTNGSLVGSSRAARRKRASDS
jgi:hypothetical protein